MTQMKSYMQPDALAMFKKDVNGRRIYILFYSASIDPEANVLCIEVTMEALEVLFKSQRVKSFVADFGEIVTIEKIETLAFTLG